ncbi:MotA/TolQ/ExbB proton channel family protein [Derxia gummosa]|uniref:MotA/TolQ/ExbB proton channel family protein n=1 Tax=Derxia gummosa DSM 723 TaxID=1121388 RepID=A0A8B6X1I1_9BURK|nr:MotA/TolQ/ExbB proton channel family protein [Derxia gummosa]
MLSILLAAGWPIWPLLIASIVALALIIERVRSLRRGAIVPSTLLPEVLTLVRKGPVPAEVANKLEANSPLGRVLAAAVRNVNAPRDVMKEAIEETGAAVAHDLEKYLTTIGTIASAAPLMGLFGTVVGMIEIFGSQGGAAGSANPAQLASGISIALYNTGFGLAIAIPTLIFYRHFRRLIDSYISEMQIQAVRLVDVVHGSRQG